MYYYKYFIFHIKQRTENDNKLLQIPNFFFTLKTKKISIRIVFTLLASCCDSLWLRLATARKHAPKLKITWPWSVESKANQVVKYKRPTWLFSINVWIWLWIVSIISQGWEWHALLSARHCRIRTSAVRNYGRTVKRHQVTIMHYVISVRVLGFVVFETLPTTFRRWQYFSVTILFGQ